MGARAHIRPNHRPLQQLLWRTSQSNTICTPSLNAHRMLTLRLKAPVRRLNGLPDIRPSDFASSQRGEIGQCEEPRIASQPHHQMSRINRRVDAVSLVLKVAVVQDHDALCRPRLEQPGKRAVAVIVLAGLDFDQAGLPRH